MAAHLEIMSHQFGYAIGWFDDEDGDVAGDLCLGEHVSDDEEHRIASLAASEFSPDNRDQGVFVWDSKSRATKALLLARSMVKAYKDGKPWPDWAKTAVSEGWKPPKGWEP